MQNQNIFTESLLTVQREPESENWPLDDTCCTTPSNFFDLDEPLLRGKKPVICDAGDLFKFTDHRAPEVVHDDLSCMSQDRKENGATVYPNDIDLDQLPNEPKRLELDSLYASDASSIDKEEPAIPAREVQHIEDPELHPIANVYPPAASVAVSKCKLKPDRYIKPMVRKFRKIHVKERYNAFYGNQKKYLYNSSLSFLRKAARDFFLATYPISATLYDRNEGILFQLIHHTKKEFKATKVSKQINAAF